MTGDTNILIYKGNEKRQDIERKTLEKQAVIPFIAIRNFILYSLTIS